MLTPALIALGLLAGVPLLVVVAVAAAALSPLLVLLALVTWGAVTMRRRRRDPTPDDEAAFLRAVGGELSAGASLRWSLVSAADGSVLDVDAARSAAVAGLPSTRVATLLGDALPGNGRVVSAAWVLASDGGAPAASVFQALALRASRVGELDRERRALTAQARASAWVVAGIPVLVLIAAVASGRLRIGSDPLLTAVVVLGVALQAAGVAVVMLMIRRASR